MLKPGDEPGFFSFGCTRIFLFLDIKKRPKLLKFGRFVYIFVYVLRKTLIFKVYCGERGIRTPGTLRYAGFQDRCIRPLYHLSLQMVAVVFGLFASAKVGGFIWIAKFMSYFFRFALKNNGFY